MRRTIKRFADLEFEAGSSPSLATLRRWIDRDELPGGEKIGGKYYVDMDVWRARGNPLVLKVLQEAA